MLEAEMGGERGDDQAAKVLAQLEGSRAPPEALRTLSTNKVGAVGLEVLLKEPAIELVLATHVDQRHGVNMGAEAVGADEGNRPTEPGVYSTPVGIYRHGVTIHSKTVVRKGWRAVWSTVVYI